ncbi:MAG: B12-binding domain-containing radical SAM protein [bacterium]|nr:B12-binding domain-containing radical SAM protein [bacterium]
MRVTLVRPPFVGHRGGPPIGLAYLCATLEKQGHQVTIEDLSRDISAKFGAAYTRDYVLPDGHRARPYAYKRLDRYCKRVLAGRPDIVGFNLSYPTVDYGLAMAERLCGRGRCIAGGPQATFREQELLDLGCFDTVVRGYGEEGVLAALDTAGIIHRELVPSREYLPDSRQVPIKKYKGILPITTTRGCPNRCAFCTQSHPYYFHSIESVVQQIRDTRGVREIMFNDSTLNVQAQRTADLFGELAKLDDKRRSHVFGMQVQREYDMYVPRMAEAGVREVRLGIESGSPRERRSMTKPAFDNDQVVRCVKLLTEHGITTWTQFIFCYPDQTDEDRDQTVALMHRINAECRETHVRHYWYQFVVHHGTEELFAKRYGVRKTTPKTWENDLYTPEIIAKTFEAYARRMPANGRIYL